MIPSACLDAADLLPELYAHLGVERRERLVEQEQTRLDRERPGERDALLHAARELMRIPVGGLVEPDELEQLPRPDLVSRLVPPCADRRPNSTLRTAVMFGKRL